MEEMGRNVIGYAPESGSFEDSEVEEASGGWGST
jgi:hypothetical protein